MVFFVLHKSKVKWGATSGKEMDIGMLNDFGLEETRKGVYYRRHCRSP